MPRVRFAIVLLAALLLGGCGKRGAPADPPTDAVVVAGDTRVTVTWSMAPDVEYWLFYAPAGEITQDNWDTLSGARVIRPAGSPTVLTGLANGTTYSFMIDGRIDSGPAGPATPSMSAVPRPAGASWTAGNPLGTPTPKDLFGIAYGTLFVAVGAEGTILTSSNGTGWDTQTSNTAAALNSALYYGGNYLAAGNGGAILRSTDAAVTWTPQDSKTIDDLYALTTSGSVYVAVGAQGAIVTSSDGQTWGIATDSSSATLNTLFDVIYVNSDAVDANSRYVAVGAGETLLTSANADKWASVTLPSTGFDLKSIAWGANTFVAVGTNGTLVTSPNGVDWKVEAAFGIDTLTSVTYASQFVAVGLSGAVYTSTNGLKWHSQTSGTTENLHAVAFGNYGYTAVGAAGTNLVSH